MELGVGVRVGVWVGVGVGVSSRGQRWWLGFEPSAVPSRLVASSMSVCHSALRLRPSASNSESRCTSSVGIALHARTW